MLRKLRSVSGYGPNRHRLKPEGTKGRLKDIMATELLFARQHNKAKHLIHLIPLQNVIKVVQLYRGMKQAWNFHHERQMKTKTPTYFLGYIIWYNYLIILMWQLNSA